MNANTGGCAYTHAGAAWDATGTDNCIPVASILLHIDWCNNCNRNQWSELEWQSIQYGVQQQ